MKTAEDILNEKKRDIVWVSGDQSVFDVVRLMVENGIGAILIKEEDRFGNTMKIGGGTEKSADSRLRVLSLDKWKYTN